MTHETIIAELKEIPTKDLIKKVSELDFSQAELLKGDCIKFKYNIFSVLKLGVKYKIISWQYFKLTEYQINKNYFTIPQVNQLCISTDTTQNQNEY